MLEWSLNWQHCNFHAARRAAAPRRTVYRHASSPVRLRGRGPVGDRWNQKLAVTFLYWVNKELQGSRTFLGFKHYLLLSFIRLLNKNYLLKLILLMNRCQPWATSLFFKKLEENELTSDISSSWDAADTSSSWDIKSKITSVGNCTDTLYPSEQRCLPVEVGWGHLGIKY